jgi:hypothetical protein
VYFPMPSGSLDELDVYDGTVMLQWPRYSWHEPYIQIVYWAS